MTPDWHPKRIQPITHLLHCGEMRQSNAHDDDGLTPRQRLMTFECEHGICPRCGAERGFSVPDTCDHNLNCPEPRDIERSLVLPETRR